MQTVGAGDAADRCNVISSSVSFLLRMGTILQSSSVTKQGAFIDLFLSEAWTCWCRG